jgi:electron transport complex protein RnfD
MGIVSFCALCAILQSSVGDGGRSLIVAAAAVFGAVASEFAIQGSTGKSKLKDGSALCSALVLTLLLPNTIHPALAAISAVFAMLVVKHSFGGLGSNWLNPAIGGWLFLRFSWPQAFSQALEGSSLSLLESSVAKGLSDPSGSPLDVLKIAGLKGGALDGQATDFLNASIFSRLGAELPKGYMDFIFFSGTGLIADRGTGALLLASLFLSLAIPNRQWISVSFLALYLVLVRIFGAVPFGGPLGEGDMLFALFSGGTAVAVFILAVDPATGTKSHGFALLLSLALAGTAFLFRYSAMESYGILYAVGAANVLVPLIRNAESWTMYRNRRLP